MAHQAYDGYLVWEHDQTEWDWDTAHTPTGGSSEEFSAMDESLTEQSRVEDDTFRGVNSFYEGRKFDGTSWIRDG